MYLSPATEKLYKLLDAQTVAVMTPEKFDNEVVRLLGAGYDITQLTEIVKQIIHTTPRDKLAGALIFKLRRTADIGVTPKRKPTEPTIKRHYRENGVEYCTCVGEARVHVRVSQEQLPDDHPWVEARKKFLTSPILTRPTAW